MINLDKKHNPHNNAQLIKKLSDNHESIQSSLSITDELFMKLLDQTGNENSGVKSHGSFIKLGKIGSKFFGSSAINDKFFYKTVVDEQGFAFPEWKTILDQEYIKLQENMTKEVNIIDFGAIGDGVTDNTKAFKKALGSGRVKVLVPEGVYITKGIKLPSWSSLVGAGKRKTVIRLSNNAPKGTRLITNSRYLRGNHHILVKGISLDWNVERLRNTTKTATWGNHSSCLTLANVTYAWVKNVEAKNPGLHGFDISSPFYDYSGDGKRARGGSQFIWLDQLNGYGFGDDGITTHHSQNIFITNCHMSDPSGRAHKQGFSNSNGIEIDDGSKNVWLVNNSTARCFGGVEIKAHHNSSAGNNVQIIGHLSVNDNRSYNFRHIGHHKSTDPDSKTAYNIRATNIISVAPVYSDLYTGSTPRCLVISAYKNVAINGFTLIGDPNYDYHGNPMIAVQYQARHVCLNRISVRDFCRAGSDIKIFGGNQHANQIELHNIKIVNSAPIAIEIGKHANKIVIDHLHATNPNGKHVIKAVTKPLKLEAVTFSGYDKPILITSKPSTFN